MSESPVPPTLQSRLFSAETQFQTPEEPQPPWSALEKIIAEWPATRMEGLEELDAAGALRRSPVAAWAAAALLGDSDAEVRTRAVEILAGVLAPAGEWPEHHDRVRSALTQRIQMLRVEDIARLISDRVGDAGARRELGLLLNLNSRAGQVLAGLAVDRLRPIEVRREAVRLIGEIGFAEAAQALERLANRLQARAGGQKAMPFAPPGNAEEDLLLPDLKRTLHALRGPDPA